MLFKVQKYKKFFDGNDDNKKGDNNEIKNENDNEKENKNDIINNENVKKIEK